MTLPELSRCGTFLLTLLGTLRAFHSGKVSYMYKLSGPSLTIDTACSSSAVAIYQACRALQTGDCTTAIAGGANIISSPDVSQKLHLSVAWLIHGRCILALIEAIFLAIRMGASHSMKLLMDMAVPKDVAYSFSRSFQMPSLRMIAFTV
jgi:hypothetical protein